MARLRASDRLRAAEETLGPQDCHARCYPVSIDGGIEAAIVLPEFTGYSPAQIEIIAAIEVRDAPDMDDGDSLRIEIR